MKIITYIVVLCIMLLGITFAMLNAELVNINYYFGIRHLPLSLLLLLAVVIGAIFGVVATLFKLLRSKSKIRRLAKKLRLAQKEVASLRAAPIHD